MLRILRDDRELPRTTRVEFRGIKPMNGIKTVADLLSKFRLAGRFPLDRRRGRRSKIFRCESRTGVMPLAADMMAARNADRTSVDHSRDGAPPSRCTGRSKTTVHAFINEPLPGRFADDERLDKFSTRPCALI